MADEPELVQFMTSEIGDDLIVSFYVIDPDDPGDGRSIILLRDKRFEFLLAEDDRGVKVTDENFPSTDDLADNFLKRIHIADEVAEIETAYRDYQLNLRHVSKSEIKSAKKALLKMNYDKSFMLTVA